MTTPTLAIPDELDAARSSILATPPALQIDMSVTIADVFSGFDIGLFCHTSAETVWPKLLALHRRSEKITVQAALRADFDLEFILVAVGFLMPQGAEVIQHFAVDCGEAVLPLFEKHFPDDLRPRQALAVNRAYLLGSGDEQALTAARAAVGEALWFYADSPEELAAQHAAKCSGFTFHGPAIAAQIRTRAAIVSAATAVGLVTGTHVSQGLSTRVGTSARQFLAPLLLRYALPTN